jgi:hypothetical protein
MNANLEALEPWPGQGSRDKYPFVWKKPITWTWQPTMMIAGCYIVATSRNIFMTIESRTKAK